MDQSSRLTFSMWTTFINHAPKFFITKIMGKSVHELCDEMLYVGMKLGLGVFLRLCYKKCFRCPCMWFYSSSDLFSLSRVKNSPLKWWLL